MQSIVLEFCIRRVGNTLERLAPVSRDAKSSGFFADLRVAELGRRSKTISNNWTMIYWPFEIQNLSALNWLTLHWRVFNELPASSRALFLSSRARKVAVKRCKAPWFRGSWPLASGEIETKFKSLSTSRLNTRLFMYLILGLCGCKLLAATEPQILILNSRKNIKIWIFSSFLTRSTPSFGGRRCAIDDRRRTLTQMSNTSDRGCSFHWN